ncbi:MAG: EamA family transporter [Endomicrobium sp.]|jgi:transporter family protein|nr:EamA family transporter [Endomicrobium sp.]
MWIIYALLSAFFAALTAIFAKIGVENVNSNLATAIRTGVILIMVWFIVFITGKQSGIAAISQRNWVFLILSALATGASWLFYFRAIQIGEVSKVAPIDKLSILITILLAFIILGEAVSIKTIVGSLLITAGALVLIL